MVIVRSISKTGTVGCMYPIASFVRNNEVWCLADIQLDPSATEDVAIKNSDLGTLIPPKGYWESHDKAGLLDNDVYFTKVTSPTGVDQHSVYHTKFEGTINNMSLQKKEVTRYWSQTWNLYQYSSKILYARNAEEFTSACYWTNGYRYSDKSTSGTVLITPRYRALVHVFRRANDHHMWKTHIIGYTGDKSGSKYVRFEFESDWYKESNTEDPLPKMSWAMEKLKNITTDYPLNDSYDTVKGTPGDLALSDIRAKLGVLDQSFSRHVTQLTSLQSDYFGDLCLRALKDARYIKVNQLEFWKDIAMTFSEVGLYYRAFTEIFKSLAENRAVRRKSKQIMEEVEWALKSKFSNNATSARYYTDKDFEAIKAGLRSRELKAFGKTADDIVGETSNAYLGTYYGTRLAMSDLQVMTDGFANFVWNYYSEFRNAVRLLHSFNNDVEITTTYGGESFKWGCSLNYNLCYNPYQGMSQVSELMETLGFGVNTHQIWECIPLSFVVDWFKDFSSIFAAWDYTNYLVSLSINYEGLGAKSVTNVTELLTNRYGWDCDLSYVAYTRRYSPVPTIHPLAINTNGKPQKHFIQGAALLLQK